MHKHVRRANFEQSGLCTKWVNFTCNYIFREAELRLEVYAMEISTALDVYFNRLCANSFQFPRCE